MKNWTVNYCGIDFTIEGTYIQGSPARITSDPYNSYPGYGPHLEECNIFVEDSKVDLYDVLSSETICYIIEDIISQEE